MAFFRGRFRRGLWLAFGSLCFILFRHAGLCLRCLTWGHFAGSRSGCCSFRGRLGGGGLHLPSHMMSVRTRWRWGGCGKGRARAQQHDRSRHRGRHRAGDSSPVRAVHFQEVTSLHHCFHQHVLEAAKPPSFLSLSAARAFPIVAEGVRYFLGNSGVISNQAELHCMGEDAHKLHCGHELLEKSDVSYKVVSFRTEAPH